MVEVGSSIVGEEVQSKFRVLERPTLHPGRCACCGAASRPVVEFGVEVDFEADGYGRLMLCGSCVKQAASKFPDEDIVPETTDEQLKQALAQQKENLYDGLLDYLNRFDSRRIPVYGSADSVLKQTEPENAASTERQPETPGGITIENSNSVSSEGPTSLSGNSSDGNLPTGLTFGNL